MLSEKLKMDAERRRARLSEIKSQNRVVFLEVKINEDVEPFVQFGQNIGVSDLKVKNSTDSYCFVSFRSNEIKYGVEIRLSSKEQLMALCSCRKGSEHSRCSHLLKAVQLYLILNSLGLVKQISVKSPYLWVPFDWQKC